MDGRTDRRTHPQTDRKTDRLTDRVGQAQRRKDPQTHSHIYVDRQIQLVLLLTFLWISRSFGPHVPLAATGRIGPANPRHEQRDDARDAVVWVASFLFKPKGRAQ